MTTGPQNLPESLVSGVRGFAEDLGRGRSLPWSHRPQISPSLVLGPGRMQPVLWAKGTPGSREGLAIGIQWFTFVESFVCASPVLTQGSPTFSVSGPPGASVIFHGAPRPRPPRTLRSGPCRPTQGLPCPGRIRWDWQNKQRWGGAGLQPDGRGLGDPPSHRWSMGVQSQRPSRVNGHTSGMLC